MDLLAMFRAVLRNRLFTIPVILLMLVGGVWVYFFSSPTYEATSGYVVFEPPDAPTASEIAQDPALAEVHADNPYARVDPSVVGWDHRQACGRPSSPCGIDRRRGRSALQDRFGRCVRCGEPDY